MMLDLIVGLKFVSNLCLLRPDLQLVRSDLGSVAAMS